RHHSMFSSHDTPTTALSTLSLHDALPIWPARPADRAVAGPARPLGARAWRTAAVLRAAFSGERPMVSGARMTDHRDVLSRRILLDRKSTRLNSSHVKISYAVFCLKKKNRT